MIGNEEQGIPTIDIDGGARVAIELDPVHIPTPEPDGPRRAPTSPLLVRGGDDTVRTRLAVGASVLVRATGGSVVWLSGHATRLHLVVLDGSRVDATALSVDELDVELEQSQVQAPMAANVVGFVGYGSVIEVGAGATVHDLRTRNAGRIVRSAT